ncbi:MAG: hypothetical protein B6243_05560, partial [Anaerolineaceae bacterium 4572_5.2]
MQNPVVFNALARFATFNDAARITELSICEILHTLNKYLGLEKKLSAAMPECVSHGEDDVFALSEDISWDESHERYIYNF